MTVDVIHDCDPGHDDAMATLLALASPEVNLLGVTTVAGNQTVAKTTANAIRVLDHVGRADVPVHTGAPQPLMRELEVADWVHGDSGLEGPELPPPARAAGSVHAVDWIADTVRANPRPVTLVATGPLTNAGLLLARHPDAAARLERIVLMGGSCGEGNVTPAAEFNIWVDPEAAHRVFGSGLDVTMVGLDVTHQALMTAEHAGRLRGSGRAGTLVAELYDYFVQFHERSYGWHGAPIHDPVAMAHVIDPGLLETVHRGVRIDTATELGRGRTHVDLHAAHWEPSCHVAVGIDGAAMLELLVERIAALG